MTAFRDGQVTLRERRRTEGYTNAIQEIGYQGIRAGDLVVHGMDGFAGAIGVSDSDGKSSPVVHAYRPSRKTDARYVAYALRTMAVNGYVSTLAKGIRERSTSFDASTLANVLLPAPPLEEQRRIADFLDAETTRIDRLTQLRSRQAGLLEERFTLALDRAFENSTHEPTRLKYLLAVKPRYGVLVPQFSDSGVRFIRVNDLLDLAGRADSLAKIPDALSSQYARTVTRPGDVLLSVVGTMGRSTVVPPQLAGANVARAVASLRTRQGVSPELLATWLTTPSFLRQASDVTGSDTAQPTLGMEDLSNFRLSWPVDERGRDELLLITSTIRRQQGKLTGVLEAQRRALAERRQALITAAVTGQFDVTTASGRNVTDGVTA
ncbi:restriction endonuclease subunit S [Streptomyces sp. NPDC020298]|uniref:restriction endonuclease subunit S n=1 Tax=unclassified Streptomyces TaxID=2593676 RepID=UPI0033C49BF5